MEEKGNAVHEEVHEFDKQFKPSRMICVCVDASEHSKEAVEWTIKNLIKKESDQVILLNTRPFMSVPEVGFGVEYVDFSSSYERIEKANREESHKLLQKWGSFYKQEGVHVRAIALRGDARQEMEAKITELNADMVVIGSRGMGLVKRTMMGSVSNHLVHHLKCPVIVVRTNSKSRPRMISMIMTLAVASANFWPMHIRGPPPNGKYALGLMPLLSHRSGMISVGFS